MCLLYHTLVTQEGGLKKSLFSLLYYHPLRNYLFHNTKLYICIDFIHQPYALHTFLELDALMVPCLLYMWLRRLDVPISTATMYGSMFSSSLTSTAGSRTCSSSCDGKLIKGIIVKWWIYKLLNFHFVLTQSMVLLYMYNTMVNCLTLSISLVLYGP